jgi:hypothetical protein
MRRAVPTLAELREHTAWTWVYCDKCLHRAPSRSCRS